MSRHVTAISLKTLISLILNGSNLKNQEKQESQACLTIGQAIVFNAKKKSTADPEAKPRHSLEPEPPLPVYTGLTIHGLTRSKHLINRSHQLGICISYETVLQLEDWIAKAICIRFDEDGVVSPVCLHRGIGVRAGGGEGGCSPPNFGQLRFLGQQEKIWAKPVFKDVSMFV